MSTLRRLRRLAPATCALLLMAMASAMSAQAAMSGEIGRYAPGSTVKIRLNTNAFGVDPTDNSVYIAGEEGVENSGKFRLQRFKMNPAAKAGGELLSTVKFQPPAEPAGKLEETEPGIEGIAIDHAKNRIYVLVRYERAEEPFSRDYAATLLYAFELNASNELVDASGTSEGILTGFSTLKPASTETTAAGAALLEPTGIAVDPVNHSIEILAEVFTGARHIAVQEILEDGAAGKRWVSPRSTTQEQEEGTLGAEGSSSPVVSASGRIYFQREGVVMQVPTSLESTVKPTPLFSFTPFEEGKVSESLLEFGVANAGGTNYGATLALAEKEGRQSLYSITEVFPYHVASGKVEPEAGGPYTGVLELNLSEAGEPSRVSERGWTGGGPETAKTCSIGFKGETYAMVAAGSGEDVFVLNNPTGETGEIVEFGPGGKGCPTAAVAPMRAEVAGKAVTTVTAGTPVKLVTEATANVTSIEWSFSDGSPSETVTTGQYQTAVLKHTFTKGGKVKVTAKVKTDDLASEELKAEMEVTVDKAPEVTEQPTAKAVVEGESASFRSKAAGFPAPTVQWWVKKEGVWSKVSGATSETLTIASAKTSESGNEYQARFANETPEGPAEARSNPATLTVAASGGKPKVEKQPANVTVVEGHDATFESEASGVPTPEVQWEVSTNGGTTFAPIAGETTGKLTLHAVTLSQSGDEYRASFKNGAGETKSSAATLTVREKKAPAVSRQPGAASVTEGEGAGFEAEATGEPAPSVQWEVLPSGGSTWSPIAGATSDRLTLSGLTSAQNASQYRARFTNEVGSATSAAATLTVNAKPPPPPPPHEGGSKEGEVKVLPFKEGSPLAAISGTSLKVAANGSFTIKVTCPQGVTACVGTVTVKTLTAVAARRGAFTAKKSILALASGSFDVSGGQVKSVTLHLSSKGKALLKRLHNTLRARATISAHNPDGESHVGQAVLTLRAAKKR